MARLWTVQALATPRVTRWCRRCDARTAFASSDKFRVNAHRRRLDVWLVHRCTICEASWNFAILERVTPESIHADVYQDFLSNDRERAWKVAFDIVRLKRTGAEVDAAVTYRVDEHLVDGPVDEVRVAMPLFVEIRLDRFLAQRLGVTRSRVHRLVDEERISVPPSLLRRPVKDGCCFTLRWP